jgi:hypothetical protein
MKTKYTSLILLTIVAVIVIAPALAAPNLLAPKYDKHVASLEDDEAVRCGQVIFNTNPEEIIDEDTEEIIEVYELEVEIEECMDLAADPDETVFIDVYLNGELIGQVEVNEFGNGKETFYVEQIDTDSAVTVGDLTSGEWRLWMKAPGPK